MGRKGVTPVRDSIIKLLHNSDLYCTEIARQLSCSLDYVREVARVTGHSGMDRTTRRREVKQNIAKAQKAERSRIRKLANDYPQEWTAYHQAKFRCLNQDCPGYENWGGRGIQFKFDSFQQFFKCIGPKPSYEKTSGGRPVYTLDRKNNDGHYEPGNVRWATWLQQANNRHRKSPSLAVDQTRKLKDYPSVHSYIQAAYGTGKNVVVKNTNS